MNILHNIFNDENAVCESLENFLEHFFAENIIPHQTVRDIGDLILCYNKMDRLRPKELYSCLLSWDEFQEFITFYFSKQDPQHYNDSDLKLHYISIESLLKNGAWKHLYEFVGTEIMKFILTKCYINVGIGNNSFFSLHTKEIRQLYKKNYVSSSNIKKITSYRNTDNSGLLVTANRKVETIAYKGNVPLGLKSIMYKANIFPYWPVSHILSRSNLESEIVSNIVDDFLQEDVGVQISSKDIQAIKKKLISLRNLLIYLVRKHKCMSPYDNVLKKILNSKVRNSSSMEVTEGTRNLDWIPCKKIFSTNKQFCNRTLYKDNIADEKSEKKRKFAAFIDGSGHLGRESCTCSEKNSSLMMNCNGHIMKKTKLDRVLDMKECGNYLKINKSNSKMQTKKMKITTKMRITSSEKYMLICEKRKKKFLKLKPLPVHIVKEFIYTVLKQILHKKLFVIKKNWTEFLNFIHKILTLGKDCSLLIKDVLNKIDSRSINWLTEVPMQFRKSILAKFLKWIWNKIVVCIVAANFYVTELSHCKNKIVFYQKQVWQSLENTMFSHLLTDRKIVPVSRRQWEEYGKLKSSGKFRILPKVDGARPILIAKKTKGDYMLLVSKVFLQQLNVQSRTSIHSMNVNELNSTWRQVVTNWKNMGKPKLYFVGVDISDAYGSVIQDKLMDIIKANTKLMLGKQKSVVFKKLICVKVKKCQLYWSSVAHFVSLPFESPRNCLLFDSGEDKEFLVKTILTTIRNAVKCQTIQRGMKKFLICQGIAQGSSPLSYALCDVYYSALDKTHLSIFKNDADFLIRSVDDYLYITPDISRARKFKDTMHKGFPDFGVFINPKKTKCNFDCIETHTMLFCGYSVDCNTLEVRPNFSCYTDVEIQHTIMFSSVNNPGRFLEAKMDQLNAVKLNRFTVDLEYNSVPTVYCNIFEASILMACRFVVIVVKLFEVINSEFLISQIFRIASLVLCTVRRLSGATGGTCVDFNGVLWIVYSAFHIILKKKGSIFHDVLKSLNPVMYSVQAKISISNREVLKHTTNIKYLPQPLKLILR